MGFSLWSVLDEALRRYVRLGPWEPPKGGFLRLEGCFPAAFVAGIHGTHGLWSHGFSRNGVFDEGLLSLAVI